MALFTFDKNRGRFKVKGMLTKGPALPPFPPPGHRQGASQRERVSEVSALKGRG